MQANFSFSCEMQHQKLQQTKVVVANKVAFVVNYLPIFSFCIFHTCYVMLCAYKRHFDYHFFASLNPLSPLFSALFVCVCVLCVLCVLFCLSLWRDSNVCAAYMYMCSVCFFSHLNPY